MRSKIKLTLLVLLILGLVGVIGYSVVKANTLGKMNHININKSDENLGIKRSKELEEAKKRADKIAKERKNKDSIVTEDEDNSDTFLNILLLGIDSRGKYDKGRSDAIMLLTIDFKSKKIKLSSFVRDTKVNIRGREDKLNHAYGYGGGEETIRVMNENFELDIRDFAEVNMFSLRDVIDSIEGLDLEVSEAERKEINYRVRELAQLEKRSDYKLLESSGFQHLNGEQVVAYARIRNTNGGDFKRTERQREVIELAIEKMKDKSIVELMSISQKVFPLIGTTLTTSEIEESLVRFFKGGLSLDIEQARFPSDAVSQSDMSTGVYYLKITDKDKNIKEIHNFVYGKEVE